MPETVQTKTRRIAKNTVLLYMRSLVSLFISLFTTRFVLKGLGVDDYGVYGVVGSFVSMFSIVSGSLSSAISRFINYSMGKGDREDMSNTFAMSLTIMLILSGIVVLLTESFGLWFLHHRMNLPPGRDTAALWCFEFSVIGSVSNFLVVPFTASIIAHEKMGVFAYIDVAEVLWKFIIAVLLVFSLGSIDKLVLYSALILLGTLTKQMVSRIYALKHFDECRIRWFWNKKKFTEMFSYAGWSFLGKTSGTFAGQGVNMIVNVVFGTAVNAARSLSWTVNHAVQIFVNNFTVAINPQVTQSYAAGEMDYMKSLLIRGTKFTFFIMWLIALPLLLETEFILKLWLGDFPDHTMNFIRISLIVNTLNILHVIFAMGIQATGKIMWYQISFGCLEFLMFGLAFVLLHNGFSPEWSYYCGLIISVLKAITMFVLCKQQLHISIKELIALVVVPLFIVFLSSSLIPTMIHAMMSPGWLRFIVVGFCCVLFTSLSCFFLGCTQSERKLLLSLVMDKIGLTTKSR